MANKSNNNSSDRNSIVNAISTDSFISFPEETQKIIIDSIEKVNERDGGILGKFFGIKKEIASMNIAATICILLIAICGIDVFNSIFTNKEIHMELISTIIPVVSLSLGFIFGKSGKVE